ncbi:MULTISPECIES: iron ABC transporter ATP-binding protein [unclassified Rhizobium]|uniref:iron ABC transporter ATP-binding protein n=1 Tax=unclassified Rhizobium TaxID=2613769 RepID=UPI00177F1DF0|nr:MULTISPECIES: ATP-binding cassette domain-containing protein [unclassified Rhizobium]MBD8688603.1 ATP-binding cassette domain-containing protein [Rhizobium sp. CFBP 13644]MBD8692895.1 ATP-binding cassette domain-containing protein [Rhizobium sp. CFBP 13717]
MIRIDHVSLQYGAARILKDVSLTIPKGGITALIGPNGAGKSSLLGLIARLQPLQEGSISIDDLPIASTPSRELAKKLAILRQDNQVASRLTVKELVGFGRFPHNRGHQTQADRQMVEEALQLFDLSDLSGRFLETLSGGQRQRALVAMAFCQDTDYLLLDEPLNNLDMYFARELMQSLRKIADQDRKTIIIVLHDINYASGFADRMIAMRAGEIVADGAPKALMTSETLETIYGFAIPVAQVGQQRIAMPFMAGPYNVN